LKRIVVIGCSGSGKSRLARDLALRTGIPAIHLDQLYWQPGWRDHPDPDAFRKSVDAIVAGERWILDGGFFDISGPGRFERADTLVMFDLPTRVCLFRAIRRLMTYRGQVRPDLAPGCPETFDLAFYRYILTYNKEQAPQRDALVAEHFKGRLVRIRNDADSAAFLSAL
jgi:adenylate kinase family enzyme